MTTPAREGRRKLRYEAATNIAVGISAIVVNGAERTSQSHLQGVARLLEGIEKALEYLGERDAD